MATADLITAFLSNEMSPERERQFLLSVAASDSLRLELKSHLMVDRILVERVQTARVPETVRASIFAAAGLGATTAPTPATAPPGSPAMPRAAAPRPGFFTRLGGRVTLAAAALALFGAGYFVGAEADDVRAVATPAVSSPTRAAAPATTDARVGARPEVATPSVEITERPSVASRTDEPQESRVAPQRRTPRAAAPSAASPDASVATTPAVSSEQTPAARPREPRRPRRGQGSPISVDGAIGKPTQEMRDSQNNTNPLSPGGNEMR